MNIKKNDKLIHKCNEYFSNRSLVKYCTWFRLEFDVEGKYSPKSFNELVDCMKEYFRNSKKCNKFYYEKKALESKINKSSTYNSLLQYFTSLLAIFAIFIASIISIVTSIKYKNDIARNDWLNRMLNWIGITTVVLIMVCFLLYVLDIIFSSNMKKSFNLLCLGIIDDIEKEISEQKSNAIEEVASTQENIDSKVNNIEEDIKDIKKFIGIS